MADFIEVKNHGSSANPSAAEKSTAMFWTANTNRQYNRLAREVAAAQGANLVDTARLMAMVNVVAAEVAPRSAGRKRMRSSASRTDPAKRGSSPVISSMLVVSTHPAVSTT